MLPTNVMLALATGLYILAVYHATMFLIDTLACPSLRVRPESGAVTHQLLVERRWSYLIGGAHLVLAVAAASVASVASSHRSLPVLGVALVLSVITAAEPTTRISRRMPARHLRLVGAGSAILLAVIPVQILATVASSTLF
ncbi:hypothetical protein [Tsukamurella tyrosinosolvens]|uniref:hypothetical protein n=1 Tax=Tsukamurella tyrosinosolvens TaxID=57704 RepID=UPI00125F95E0|nr:hypothetical protein [Tsukamurella tyrosinosolvens]